jgi:hypothetical protein
MQPIAAKCAIHTSDGDSPDLSINSSSETTPAPGVLAPVYLEGTYSEIYPDKSEDEEGMRRFFKQFSFPGGIGSRCTPETPGSIHEGGELGYSISHAFGAAFENPDLPVAVAAGDGEAETGPLATSWHSGKFLNPIRDGAVLPILHLNGYKIDNQTAGHGCRHQTMHQGPGDLAVGEQRSGLRARCRHGRLWGHSHQGGAG